MLLAFHASTYHIQTINTWNKQYIDRHIWTPYILFLFPLQSGGQAAYMKTHPDIVRLRWANHKPYSLWEAWFYYMVFYLFSILVGGWLKEQDMEPRHVGPREGRGRTPPPHPWYIIWGERGSGSTLWIFTLYLHGQVTHAAPVMRIFAEGPPPRHACPGVLGVGGAGRLRACERAHTWSWSLLVGSCQVKVTWSSPLKQILDQGCLSLIIKLFKIQVESTSRSSLYMCQYFIHAKDHFVP